MRIAEAYPSGQALEGLIFAFGYFSSKDALLRFPFFGMRPFLHSVISQEAVKSGRASVSVVLFFLDLHIPNV